MVLVQLGILKLEVHNLAPRNFILRMSSTNTFSMYLVRKMPKEGHLTNKKWLIDIKGLKVRELLNLKVQML